MLCRRNPCGNKLTAYEPCKADEDVSQRIPEAAMNRMAMRRSAPAGALAQENDMLKRKGMNQGLARMRLRRWFLMGLAVSCLANVAIAGTITFGGTITQSTQDGTGPAANNPT